MFKQKTIIYPSLMKQKGVIPMSLKEVIASGYMILEETEDSIGNKELILEIVSVEYDKDVFLGILSRKKETLVSSQSGYAGLPAMSRRAKESRYRF